MTIQPWPIESDEPEKGQTILFSLQGVCVPIYGRIMEKGETESKVMTFAYQEIMTVQNSDIARRVMARSDLYALMKRFSPVIRK